MRKGIEKKLNKEQLEAIKHRNGPLLIIAGAGTGKTTVVTERIKHLISGGFAKPSEILALTFTEKAAREMEERVDIAMPYGYTQMWISTFHAFCDQILKKEALAIGLDPKYHLMTTSEAIQLVRKNLFTFHLNYYLPLGNPTKFVGGLLQHFSRLQDEDVSPSEYLHWSQAKRSGVRRLGKEERLEAEKWKELAEAYCVYDEIKVKEGLLDFGDLITKTLYLFRNRPNILASYKNQFKYILVDEFQDTNIAQNELIKLLAGEKANLTVVADDDQCLPAGTKVKTKAGLKPIENVKEGERVVSACGKGYTTLSRVTKVMKSEKECELLTVITQGGHKITVTDNHKMFCLTPSKVFEKKSFYYVYLMERRDLGWRVGVTDDLAQRLRLERSADRIIGIKACKTEGEAKYYETYYALKYCLPTVCFKERNGVAIRGEWLQKLYKDFDTSESVQNLAHDINIDLNTHHFSLGGVYRGRKSRVKINLLLCRRRNRTKWARNRYLLNPQVSHSVYVETSDGKILKKLRKAGFKLSEAKKGWTYRGVSTNLLKIGEIAKKLQEVTNGIIEAKFDMGKRNQYTRSANVMPAKNLLPGLYIPVLQGYEIQYERIKKITKETKRQKVYDLEIERTHNFIANNIVVHNSIYKWRGAAVSNVIQFRKSFPETKIVTLTKNYRSTQEILNRAYSLIQFNNPDRLEVVEKIDKKLESQRKVEGERIIFVHADRVENEADSVTKNIRKLIDEEKYSYKDFAILIRANNHADPFLRSLVRMGIPAQFLGPGQLFRQPEIRDLIAYLRVLNNYEDSASFFRVISMNHLGIFPRDLATIGNYSRRFNLSLFEAAEKIEQLKVDAATKEKVRKLLEMLGRHMGLLKKETAGQIVYYFLEDSNLLVNIANPDTVNAEKVAANISKFFDKLKTYEVDHEDATVPAVLDWIDLAQEVGESPLATDIDWGGRDAVNILTVHSAKGLEFPVVFLVNLVGERFPTVERREQIPIPDDLIKEVLPVGDYHLEEERRLFYVGMTRAKERLFFTAANYYGEGKRQKRLSPFISEALGDEVLQAEKLEKEGEQLSFLEYMKGKEEEKEVKPRGIHIDYLSYSQIETFRICPLHYKLRYMLKIPTPPSSSQSFGNSFHLTMKAFYEQLGLGLKPTKELITSLLKSNWIKEGYLSKSHETESFKKAERFLLHYLKNIFDPNRIPVATEIPFNVPIRGFRIGGKIDRVDQLPTGEIEIIDYKTGAHPLDQKTADKDLQLSIYALAATEIAEPPFKRISPEKVRLSFCYFDNPQIVTTFRDKNALDAARKEIANYRDAIINSDFKCSGNFLCENCEYKEFCMDRLSEEKNG